LKIKALVASGLLLIGAFAGSLSAAPLAGTFNIDGVITVTVNEQLFESNLSVANQAAITGGASAPTGSFAGLAGTDVTISNLDRVMQPVNTPFPELDFISFLAAPSLSHLNLNFINLGLFGSAQCFAPPAAGQLCTPSVPGGSPFSFINTSANTSTASWAMRGVSADHLSVWRGVFTSQFTTPYQSVLGSFIGNGSVTSSYSASFIVVPNESVPEPNTTVLLGGGLILLALGLRRLKSVA